MDKFFFANNFYYITTDSKSRAQELSNDVSFVIFGHQTWDLGGVGGQFEHILVFKYPSRDRVKGGQNKGNIKPETDVLNLQSIVKKCS